MAHTSARLRFPVSTVGYWSTRYDYRYDSSVVEKLVPTVREQGFLTKSQLLAIVDWKAPRSRRHAQRASDALVVEATREGFSSQCEELRIGIPALIPGMGYPVGSVLLHFFHSDPYPIIDYRALWSLGLDQNSAYYTFDRWWAYVEACRGLSQEAGVDMRVLDRALWQYSKENQPVRGTEL
jgi:hypothetical protein